MGTRTATAKVGLTFDATAVNTLDADSSGAPPWRLVKEILLDLLSGTTENQVDRVIGELKRSISGSETIDLFDFAGFDIGAGAGRDGLGQTVQLAEVVVMVVVCLASSTGTSVTVGGEGSAGEWSGPFASAGDQITVPKGGFMAITNPNDPAWTVTDATDHLLDLTANGGDVDVDILLLGRSA